MEERRLGDRNVHLRRRLLPIVMVFRGVYKVFDPSNNNA
jgi:hypothetical protein